MKVNTSLWNDTDHVVIAVSTGIDSMSLLHYLLSNTQTYKQLTCLHINHGLREESQQEESFIKAFCEQYKINCYVKRLDLSNIVAQGKSIQADARRMRYEWFDTMMTQLEANVFITAHHLNDQLETIFYRLFTGRSTRSSLGMDERSWRDSYRMVRPLLNTTKSDIYRYQQHHQVPYYEDKSNSDNKYARNDIRNRLLPAIDSHADLDTTQLLKLKEWHDIQLQLTHQRVNQFIDSEFEIDKASLQFQCSRHAFKQLDEVTQMVLLDQLFERIQLGVTFSEKNYRDWFHKINSEIAQFEITLSEKWIIQIAYDKFIIMAQNETDILTEQIVTNANTYRFGTYIIKVHPSIEQQSLPLTIRTRHDGDKFKLNGQKGHKKVSRLFIDNKIHNDERMCMPLIEDRQHNIIAVGNLFIASTYDKHIDIKKIGDE